MLMIYPISRFLEEIIRTDEPAVFGTGLSISQNISLAVFVAGIGLWFYLSKQPARRRLAGESVGVSPCYRRGPRHVACLHPCLHQRRSKAMSICQDSRNSLEWALLVALDFWRRRDRASAERTGRRRRSSAAAGQDRADRSRRRDGRVADRRRRRSTGKSARSARAAGAAETLDRHSRRTGVRRVAGTDRRSRGTGRAGAACGARKPGRQGGTQSRSTFLLQANDADLCRRCATSANWSEPRRAGRQDHARRAAPRPTRNDHAHAGSAARTGGRRAESDAHGRRRVGAPAECARGDLRSMRRFDHSGQPLQFRMFGPGGARSRNRDSI